jgi:hypothetical protein
MVLGRKRNPIALGVFLALAGCASIAGDPERTTLPYDVPYDERGRLVAVCYSAHVSTVEQVSAAAAEFCGEQDTPVTLWREDLVFNDCPIVKKRRAVFACRPLKK